MRIRSIVHHVALHETLENRAMFAAAAFASLSSHGTLNVSGTSLNDVISVRRSGSDVIASRNSSVLRFHYANVKRIMVKSLDGSDRFINHTSRPSTLVGGAGNDTLQGNVGADVFDGGTGNNFFDPRGGKDVFDYTNLAPGPFERFVIVSSSEAHFVERDYTDSDFPTGGDDFVWTPNITVRLSPNDDLVGALMDGTSVEIDGGEGNDSINVSKSLDYSGLLAPRTLLGGGGNDDIEADDGNNVLLGGVGADTLIGGFGKDSLDGGPGNDLLKGGAGNDTLIGGPGKDTLLGQSGNDRLIANDGEKDFLDGGSGTDKAQRDKTAKVSDSVKSIESFIP